jgi:hypothetical protein
MTRGATKLISGEPFKPDYDGPRPPTRTTAPERQTLRQEKPELVRRLHRAMLTMAATGTTMDLGIKTGGVPKHIEEFGDRVGVEVEADERPRFRPTPRDVSDQLDAFDLLQGLRPHFFKVVLLRALNDFAEEEGARGEWSWSKIGGYFGLSESWAQDAYNQAIVQAARRAGMLPMVQQDHAILCAAAGIRGAWLTQVSTTKEPRQALANLRGKSPVAIEQAFCIWLAGEPVAKRVVEAARQSMRNLCDHGSWYKVHPDRLCTTLTETALAVGSAWMVEDLPGRAP